MLGAVAVIGVAGVAAGSLSAYLAFRKGSNNRLEQRSIDSTPEVIAARTEAALKLANDTEYQAMISKRADAMRHRQSETSQLLSTTGLKRYADGVTGPLPNL